MKSYIDITGRWMLAMLLGAWLLFAPVAKAQEQAAPAGQAQAEMSRCEVEAAAAIPPDPTPQRTGADAMQTFNQSLTVSGLALSTILLVMAAFGGLTALLTRVIPAKQE